MPQRPIVFTTTRRVQFSDLDPYHHASTARFATWYVDHRMQGLSERIGWDIDTLATLPFAVWVRRMELDYIRPVLADQEITITSFVREFAGPDAMIDLSMADASGKVVSRAHMVVACVDKTTSRAIPWPVTAMALFLEDTAEESAAVTRA